MVYFALVPSIGVVYLVPKWENGLQRSYGPPRRLKFEEAAYFIKLIGALPHSNCSKVHSWGSLFSDRDLNGLCFDQQTVWSNEKPWPCSADHFHGFIKSNNWSSI